MWKQMCQRWKSQMKAWSSFPLLFVAVITLHFTFYHILSHIAVQVVIQCLPFPRLPSSYVLTLPPISPHSSPYFLSFLLPSSFHPSFRSLLIFFLPMLPLFCRFPQSPLFHIKLFFIEAHAAWNSIPPGAAGWNTRLFWAPAKQMLALGVPPETSLHAFLFSLPFSLFLQPSCYLSYIYVLLIFMLFVSSLSIQFIVWSLILLTLNLTLSDSLSSSRVCPASPLSNFLHHNLFVWWP